MRLCTSLPFSQSVGTVVIESVKVATKMKVYLYSSTSPLRIKNESNATARDRSLPAACLPEHELKSEAGSKNKRLNWRSSTRLGLAATPCGAHCRTRHRRLRNARPKRPHHAPRGGARWPPPSPSGEDAPLPPLLRPGAAAVHSGPGPDPTTQDMDSSRGPPSRRVAAPRAPSSSFCGSPQRARGAHPLPRWRRAPSPRSASAGAASLSPPVGPRTAPTSPARHLRRQRPHLRRPPR